MSVDVKPGWWRMRNGEIAYVAVIRTDGVPYRALGWVGPDCETWTIIGEFIEDDADDMDLIEHLPDCTGFDWKPEPKYVPWTFDEKLIGSVIRHKQSRDVVQICHVAKNLVAVPYYGQLSYEEVFRFFEQLDGKPAGRLSE